MQGESAGPGREHCRMISLTSRISSLAEAQDLAELVREKQSLSDAVKDVLDSDTPKLLNILGWGRIAVLSLRERIQNADHDATFGVKGL